MWEIVSYSHEDHRRHGDAAVVLGAAVYGNTPSPVLQARIDHAIHLYQNGDADTIIFTGGRSESNAPAESEVSSTYAIQNGVFPEDIYIEDVSRITESNLIQAKKLGDTQLISTYTLVSDPLHMKRAMAIAQQLGMDVVSSPTQSSGYQSFRTKVPFLMRETFLLMGYRVVQWIK
ncbi:YdcF family protein [Paenibacillus sp. 453mf]|uniref:YdcF family protein n=1 Tax=Paenibacillus sp. 453mf TaxID=1761874 RepID=UPI0008EFED2D|nr:YdcF family protein [Paenibacillus sp. 453mf]SFS48912.1 DUF218 domain-containing protein [Paenibacillus sp. 453mf]